MDRRWTLAVVALFSAAWSAPAIGQSDLSEVVARVEAAAIYAIDVERLVQESLKDRKVPEESRAALSKAALEQLISRRLILARLEREGQGAAADEVDRALKALQLRAEQEKQPFADWLKRNQFTPDTLRDEVAWRIAWRRYLQQQVTDAALQEHFEKHRRHFDGSQVRVSQIRWKVDASAESAARDAMHQLAMKEAARMQMLLRVGAVKFADAARQHSAAPSREQGGDIGFIPRHGVMDEAFARAAFDLEKGAVSPPTLTPFGVHLIQCTDIRPGDKKWTDCREDLHLAVSQALFDRLAAQERRTARIEYARQ
jgi:peptidyl-prolyl cis-trans isomerase C